MLKTNRIELIPLGQNDLDFFIKINHNPVGRKFLWDDVIMPVLTGSQGRDTIYYLTPHETLIA